MRNEELRNNESQDGIHANTLMRDATDYRNQQKYRMRDQENHCYIIKRMAKPKKKSEK